LTHDDLYALVIPGDPQLSADGRRGAWVITRVDRAADGYTSHIWSTTFTDHPPIQLTRGGADSHPRFAPDGRSLAFLSARAGKSAQVYLLDLDGGEARAVTDLDSGVTGFAWSPDGTRLAVMTLAATKPDDANPNHTNPDHANPDHANPDHANPDHANPGHAIPDDNAPVVIERLAYKADGAGLLRGRRSQLFSVDIATGNAERLTSPDRDYAGPVWSPDGRTIAVTASLAEDSDIDIATVVLLIDLDARGQRAVTPNDGHWSVCDWSSDGASLLLTGSAKEPDGLTRLATVPVAGGDPQLLLADLDRNVMVGAPGYPGARPRYTADGIVFCVRDRGLTHLLRLPTGANAPQVLLGGDHSVAGATHAAGRFLAVATTPHSGAEIYTCNADTQWRPLTTLFTDALPDVDLVIPDERHFTAPDGERLHGWLLRDPATTGPAPTLLDIHGGPHNSWSPVFDGVHLYHQVLAAAGWNVLFVNPRASDGYGERFWKAAQGAWGTADEQDFHAALDGLVVDGLADPDRIAVTGYSYGGYMTCWLTARSDRFRAAVPGGAIVNLVATSGTSDMGMYLSKYEFGGFPWDGLSALDDSAPITHVGKVRTPTLLLHGDADDRCPVSEAEQWFAALRLRGVAVQLVRYPGGSHLFILSGRPSHRVDYGRRLVEWVQRWS
jgi:dipeptidyl aminopeptidase/acylaminoacyl peptidase